MNKSISIVIAFLMAGQVFFAQAQNSLKNEEDKIFYAVGVMFGGKLKDLKLSEKEMGFLVKGLRDSASGRGSEVDVAIYSPKVRELFTKRAKEASKLNKKEGMAYLEKFLKEEGAKKAKAGLAYKMLKKGSGKRPKKDDKVEVHYHGTTIDGTVFDSSVDRKKTATFPLNRVIRGWTEGLQLVGVGGKIRLVIPSDLGYGDHGAPPKIPGGATLIFDVELIKILPKVVRKKKKGMAKGKGKSEEKKK